MSERLHLNWYWHESRKLVSESIRLLNLVSRHIYLLQSNIAGEAIPDRQKGKEKAIEFDSAVVLNQETGAFDSNFDSDSEFEMVRLASLQESATCAEESFLPEPSSSRNPPVYDFRSGHNLLADLSSDLDSDDGYTYP
jgi:hypothetical protein